MHPLRETPTFTLDDSAYLHRSEIPSVKRRSFIAAAVALVPGLAVLKAKRVADYPVLKPSSGKVLVTQTPVVDDRMLIDVLVLELKTLFPDWTWERFNGLESTWQVTAFFGTRILYQLIPKESKLLPKSRIAYHETFRRMIESKNDQDFLARERIRRADLAINPPLIDGKMDTSFLDGLQQNFARGMAEENKQIIKAFNDGRSTGKPRRWDFKT